MSSNDKIKIVIQQLKLFGKGTHQDLEEIINRMDKNGDGKITISELHKAFTDRSAKYGVLHDIPLEAGDLARIFKGLDLNKDGTLQTTELLRALEETKTVEDFKEEVEALKAQNTSLKAKCQGFESIDLPPDFLPQIKEMMTQGPAAAPFTKALAKWDEMRGEAKGLSAAQFKELLVWLITDSANEMGPMLLEGAAMQSGEASMAMEWAGISPDKKLVPAGPLLKLAEAIVGLVDGIFDVLDVNQDGILTEKELLTVIGGFACCATGDSETPLLKRIATVVFAILDTDRSGAIDSKELAAMVMKIFTAIIAALKAAFAVLRGQAAPPDEMLEGIFQQFDTDGNGCITVDEVQANIKMMFQDPQVKDMLALASGKWSAMSPESKGMFLGPYQTYEQATSKDVETIMEEHLAAAAMDPSAMNPMQFASWNIAEVMKAKVQLFGTLAATIGIDVQISREQFVKCATPIWAPTIRSIARRGALFAIANFGPMLPPPASELAHEIIAAIDTKLKESAVGPIVGALFDVIDADDSGSLSLQEYKNIQVLINGPGETPPGPDGVSWEQRSAALLALFDKDGDGKVTLAELKNFGKKVIALVLTLAEVVLDVLIAAAQPGVTNKLVDLFKQVIGEGGLTRKQVTGFIEDPSSAMMLIQNLQMAAMGMGGGGPGGPDGMDPETMMMMQMMAMKGKGKGGGRGGDGPSEEEMMMMMMKGKGKGAGRGMY